jgi:hypothetical protein
MSEERRQRLEVHRELQLLRAAAWRPQTGQGRRKRQWVAERIRKADQVKRAK